MLGAAKARAAALWAAAKGDGCTASPDLSYTACCNRHDADYSTGTDEAGDPLTRAAADRRLRECMKAAGKTPILGRWVLPWFYWLGVRAFGRSHWGRDNDNA